MKMSEIANFRINVISKEDDSRRISIVVNCIFDPIQAKTTIAKLKRTIQQQYHELYHVSMLISVIEDSEGFVLSNNSVVGDHLRHGDTVYVQSHKDKFGTNMNLPSNLPDLFLTLRYVSGSVIKRLSEVQIQLSPLQVVPQIIHLGFWYSNIETVTNFCKLLNKLFTTDNLDTYSRQAHQMQNTLLLKVLYFWFQQVKESFAAFPQVFEELMALLYKLSLNRIYSEMLRNHKLLKVVLELSKEQRLQPQLKRMAVQIIRNVSGKGGMKDKVQSSYIPTALGESTFEISNIDEVLQALASGSQQNKAEALQQLAQHPKLITEATVRFDYYWKLTGVFLVRSIKDKTSARVFTQVLKSMLGQTSREKAAQIMQKDIIKRIHNFLLDSHIDAHQIVYEYYSFIAKESAARGVFNIEQASSNELLASPYTQFQKITTEALAQMSERKVSPIRFLPSIKDYLRLALKSQDHHVSTCLMRTLSNLTLDQQCRYQIVNLKGIEVLIKFLEIGQKNNNSQLQRACAKGLLNLSIGSRETKAKILGRLSNILQRYYKGGFDTIASSYIENILKAPKI